MNELSACQRLIKLLEKAGVGDQRVLAAMSAIPREQFVPPSFAEHAYDNTALPIGQGQTVSQPEIVAVMTAALDLTDRHKLLEIGTGSGYQTAILAKLARRVYTIERHKSLLLEAEARFAALGIRNVTSWHGDGSLGWPAQAPFDRIIVTAAASLTIPTALLEQLKPDGILIIPLGPESSDRAPNEQRLIKVTNSPQGPHYADLGAVRFVPLVSEAAAEPPPAPRSVGDAIARLRRPKK